MNRLDPSVFEPLRRHRLDRALEFFSGDGYLPDSEDRERYAYRLRKEINGMWQDVSSNTHEYSLLLVLTLIFQNAAQKRARNSVITGLLARDTMIAKHIAEVASKRVNPDDPESEVQALLWTLRYHDFSEKFWQVVVDSYASAVTQKWTLYKTAEDMDRVLRRLSVMAWQLNEPIVAERLMRCVE